MSSAWHIFFRIRSLLSVNRLEGVVRDGILHVISAPETVHCVKERSVKVGSFVWVGGDCHIYKNHKKQVLEQLKRTPKSLPNLEMPSFSNLDELLQTRPIGYVLKNYDPMDSIKAPMAI